MRVREGGFVGARGTRLFRRSWLPDGQARGVLVLVHGMSEHSGRYEHVGRFLADRGLAIHAYDHRGHGRSQGERGTAEDFDDFLADLRSLFVLVQEEHPDAGGRLVLFGHSMGGLIATAYVLDSAPKPDLLVLSSPAIVPLIGPGDRTIDPSRLSHDPEVWRAYMEDPLVLRERVQDTLFVRLAAGLSRLVGRAGEIRLPFLLVHGEEDQVCSAEGARLYLSSSASTDATLRSYPGGRHELFNETFREQVLDDLWSWLDERLPR